MTTEPTIVERRAQPYVGIVSRVTMSTINDAVDRLPELFGWLGERGGAMADAPFLKYNVIDMERELEIEVGIPTAEPVEGEGEIRSGALPAGRYVSATHLGHTDELIGVTADVLAWAEQRGLRWDVADTPNGQRWGCRLEMFRTDPNVEPDMSKWETQLLFRLADD